MEFQLTSRIASNVRHMIMLRRHLSRASSTLLPSDTSLYNAMQAIIGQELRARYETPQEVPREVLQLWRI